MIMSFGRHGWKIKEVEMGMGDQPTGGKNEASTTNPINQAMMVLGLITMRSHLRCSMINFGGGGTDGYST